ncbi:MAG TPA: hypothetical protein VEO95_06635 [Chthoniobacteraceae bacterium]|nr:hypothetical protein [Chthoniobacteraceae bacterium]
MTAEELKTTLRELPAGPFVVYLKERTPIHALHTDYAMTSPEGTILNVHDKERMHWIEAKSITRITCSRPKQRHKAKR